MTDLETTLRKIERWEPPDLWEEIERRAEATPPEPALRRRWAPAVVALATTAATLVLLVATFVVPQGGEVGGALEARRIDLGIDYVRTDVVAGDGRVWILTTDEDYGWRVASVDPETLESRVFPLGVGDADGTLGGLAVGEGSVWVTFSPLRGGRYDREPGVVFRLDPATGEILAQITVGSNPGGVAVADGIVWVAEQAERRVAMLDASSGEPVGTVDLADAPGRVVAAFGSIWADIPYGATSVIKMDPSTGEVLATVEGVSDPSAGLDTLFVMDQDGEPNGAIRQIDPETAAIIGNPLGLDVQPAMVVAGEGQVWIGRWVKDETPSPGGEVLPGQFIFGEFRFFQLDPASLEPTGLSLEACPNTGGAAIAFGSLWFSCEGDLFRAALAEAAPPEQLETSPIQVPDVRGLPLEDAVRMLEDVGLIAEISRRGSDDVAAGVVIEQDPSPGSAVESESAVSLVVSDEPGAAGCGEPTTQTSITLTDQLSFDAMCLAVPADQSFSLELRNAAPGIHANVAIYDPEAIAEFECSRSLCPPGADPLFRGEIIQGPDSIVYEIPALPAGTYVVRDDVHPAANAQLVVVPSNGAALVEIDGGYRIHSDVFDLGDGELLRWELVLLRTDDESRLCDGSGLALAYRDGESTDWQSCPSPYLSYEVFLGQGEDVLVVGALDPRVTTVRIEGEGGSADGLTFPLSEQAGSENNAFVVDASDGFPGTLLATDADGNLLQEQGLSVPSSEA